MHHSNPKTRPFYLQNYAVCWFCQSEPLFNYSFLLTSGHSFPDNGRWTRCDNSDQNNTYQNCTEWKKPWHLSVRIFFKIFALKIYLSAIPQNPLLPNNCTYFEKNNLMRELSRGFKLKPLQYNSWITTIHRERYKQKANQKSWLP